MDSLFNLSKKAMHRRSMESFDIFNNVNENWAITLEKNLPIQILRELEKESRMFLCELTMCQSVFRREQNGWENPMECECFGIGSICVCLKIHDRLWPSRHNCGVVDTSLSRGQLTQLYLKTLQILNFRRKCDNFNSKSQ